jgi:YfiR/HmsC-like
LSGFLHRRIRRKSLSARSSQRSTSHRARCLLCETTILLTVLLWAPRVGSQEGPSEYQVKAAFLFNFGKFVEWPESSFVGANSPFSVCLLGDDPFGATLDQTLHGKTIANRPVMVSRAKEAASARHCQILFVGASEKSHLAGIFAALRGSNVLLVGETDGFAASGGAIQFTIEDNHIRFMINPDSVQRAGLQISSQLLALARIVRDERGAGKG